MSYACLSKKIKLLLLDVDGVLTNGQIVIGQSGELCKAFHVADGLGISIAQRLGLKVGIITGRKSAIVEKRAQELGIEILYMGIANKLGALQEIVTAEKISLAEVAYMGDDLNDLAVLQKVGFAAAPANAAVEVKERVHYIAHRSGGQGAVRELVEYILKEQGLWKKAIQEYLQQGQGDVQ